MNIGKQFREFFIISAITLVLFGGVDLVMGRIYPKVYRPTSKYGWDVPANTIHRGSIQDTQANVREVTVQYFEHGFKRWPSPDTRKPRVLVIGDSFTQMLHVSNGEEWYAYLEQAFPHLDFYVFGGSGYGTLQEWMVLDDHFDTIQPQAIIWQFCSNDYVNNLYALDRRIYPYNNHATRPYLEDDQVVYKLPLPLPAWRQVSFAADQLLYRYDQKAMADASKDLAGYFQRKQEQFDNLNPSQMKRYKAQIEQSRAVTQQIMGKVKARANPVPIYFFNACSLFTENDRKVCQFARLNCLDFVTEYFENLEQQGLALRVENDGHWNRLGNQKVGERLVKYFQNEQIFSGT